MIATTRLRSSDLQHDCVCRKTKQKEKKNWRDYKQAESVSACCSERKTNRRLVLSVIAITEKQIGSRAFDYYTIAVVASVRLTRRSTGSEMSEEKVCSTGFVIGEYFLAGT